MNNVCPAGAGIDVRASIPAVSIIIDDAKEAFGKATGDAKTTAEGKADQTKGKAQNAKGSVKDALKGK